MHYAHTRHTEENQASRNSGTVLQNLRCPSDGLQVWSWLRLETDTWVTAYYAGIYYSIAYIHGDFTEDHLEPNSNWIPCISAVDGFASSFLFSLETQHTIGYGTRQTTTECPDAMILMSVQVIHMLQFETVSICSLDYQSYNTPLWLCYIHEYVVFSG